VLVTRREKRTCPHCEQGGVAAAPAPARIIEKGLVSDWVVIDTVISKYSDHLPLYRQSVMLERETGLEISRATLDGWVMTVGGLLIPMAAAMRRELVGGAYIQADETPVDVQMHDRRGKNHQAYLWQYSRPGGSVVFDFQLGRGRDGPKKLLAGFNGILQTDGYAAYDKVGGPKLVHGACWSHYPDSSVIWSRVRSASSIGGRNAGWSKGTPDNDVRASAGRRGVWAMDANADAAVSGVLLDSRTLPARHASS
jgi:hypothetical protein